MAARTAGAAAIVFLVLRAGAATAQILPPTERARRVDILREPEAELLRDDLAILRWTTTNPGGSDDHFAVARCGTESGRLDRVARSHVRLNRGHPETVFRVRIDGLAPRTTYYCQVSSVGSDGSSDGAESGIVRFTTPAVRS